MNSNLYAIVEVAAFKDDGRILATVKCPICLELHYHYIGRLFKGYIRNASVITRQSLCPLSLEYTLVYDLHQPPNFIMNYYEEDKELVLELLKKRLEERLLVLPSPSLPSLALQ